MKKYSIILILFFPIILADDFQYHPGNKLDPFEPVGLKIEPEKLMENKGSEKILKLQNVRLIGTMLGTINQALIDNSEGSEPLLVKVGDRIGIDKSYILSIDKDHILVRETLPFESKGPRYKDHRINLYIPSQKEIPLLGQSPLISRPLAPSFPSPQNPSTGTPINNTPSPAVINSFQNMNNVPQNMNSIPQNLQNMQNFKNPTTTVQGGRP